jgi:predicted Holliday junction resolvase-like endonuclease
MSKRESRKARGIIRTLQEKGFYAECPCCGEPVRLRDCGLFYLDEFTPEAEEIYNQLTDDLAERKREMSKRKEQISTRSELGAKAVNIGFILERLAPSMSAFRFARNDCRSLFDPIDYVIFEGLSESGAVNNIVFADIKTGAAILKPHQREIRSLVQTCKVQLETYPSENQDD